ncbi:MAG: PstS family phosphate ABC transporter substrate-binding protein, partial [Gemmatimonadota bacterium]
MNEGTGSIRARARTLAGTIFGVGAAAVVAASCGEAARESIEVDGSSTVFPVTEAVAEEYTLETEGATRVTVGLSGTGGGFRRFCAGETPITNASRPIKQEEIDACEAAGVDPIELAVAYDGIAVVVHPENDFVECLEVEELRRMWEPGSEVERWSDVRSEWPDEPIQLYGPGTSSGTFDYFTEAIVGEEDASRADYTASEDDNVLVQGVAGNAGALGYFGYAYYTENAGQIELVAVDDEGAGCVRPTPETIMSGEYSPLSRPLYLYVARSALERPEVRRFIEFYLSVAPEVVPEVGYVPLPAEEYDEARATIERAMPTAAMSNAPAPESPSSAPSRRPSRAAPV